MLGKKVRPLWPFAFVALLACAEQLDDVWPYKLYPNHERQALPCRFWRLSTWTQSSFYLTLQASTAHTCRQHRALHIGLGIVKIALCVGQSLHESLHVRQDG